MNPSTLPPALNRFLRLAALVALPALAGACVWRTHHTVETVHKIDAHIVLDIRQIKEEGAQVENYVRGNTDTPPPVPPAETPTSLLDAAAPEIQLASASLLDVLDISGRAWAAEEEKVSADDEKSAIERRRERAAKIEEALKQGTLGENERGYLSVLLEKSKDAEAHKKLEELSKAENADRKLLYRATAQRLESEAPNKLALVEIVRAEQIRDVLKPGQMFQAPKDEKFFEEFKSGKLGKQYPDAKPGQWLRKK